MAHGIGTSTLKYRIRQGGMSPEEAVGKPMSEKLKRKPVTIDGTLLRLMNAAAKYLADRGELTIGRARHRLQNGDSVD